MRRVVVRWLLVLLVLLAGLGFALWWSTSAVSFGASRSAGIPSQRIGCSHSEGREYRNLHCVGGGGGR